MTKQMIIDAVAQKADVTKKDAEKCIDSLVTVIGDSLRSGEKIMVAGLGSFEVSERAGRKGRNPQTGAEIDIPASKGVKFHVTKSLKNTL